MTAAQYGLTRDIGTAGAGAFPARGEAAKLLAQALDVDLIERDYGTDTYSRETGVTLRTKLCASGPKGELYRQRLHQPEREYRHGGRKTWRWTVEAITGSGVRI